MADDFDAAGIRWWSTARTAPTTTTTTSSSFNVSSAIAVAPSVSCSTTITDPRSIDQQPASGPLIDSSLQISGYGMDWNQSLLRSSATAGRAEPGFNAMLQESFSYPSIDSGPHHHQSHHIGSEQFLVDHQQQPALSMMLQGLFEPAEAKPHHPILNYQNPSSVAVSSQFMTSPSTKQQQQQQLQFSSSAAFWNASAGAVSDARSGFYPLALPVQFGTATAQGYEHKPSCSSLTSKSNSDTVQKKSTGSGGSGSGEPALKKSRIEAPSPLPTFKVRKEKLGDRITALQQLVSPFGKTDTASVLHEAIEYIKFLHEQVSVLSAPYLKNGHPMQHQQQQSSGESMDSEGARQDLRSRGLCLVPIESTYPVASETTADFWTPTFGGTYR